jgi:hypothetical protein
MKEETSNGNRIVKHPSNRHFLLSVIFLLGMLIISSLAAIYLLLTTPQSKLSAYQAATPTSNPAGQRVEAAPTPAASATVRRIVPPIAATPEPELNPDSERIVDYRETSTGTHRIIRYSGTLQGTHRIVSYDGIVVESPLILEGSDRATETPRRGRIVPYGTQD